MHNREQIFPSEQPFPLGRLFRRRFIPAFLGFTGLFLVLLGITARHVIEEIYLEQAQRRAQTIARAVADIAPAPWAHLMAGTTLAELQNSTDAAVLSKAFTDEVREMNLPELKVYDMETRVLFATKAGEIGSTEPAQALRNTIDNSTSSIVTKKLPDGTSQYELYVPVFDDKHNVRTVFELYEPVTYLNAILINAAIPTMAVPAGLLLLLIFALNVLVGRAQRDIDARTSALKALQDRLSSFVSSTAISAARSAGQDGGIKSQKVETTLFYSDIRDFTGFSEQNPAETVVSFLNDIMTLQVDAIKKHGGDVDKMIGDAVLARFDGDDGDARAIAAAREIQSAIKAGNYPRKLGIGIHTGEVISGAIGPEDRRDFTVIGDAVNISARLCALAKADEIVVDADMADDAFSTSETVQVKGRVQGIAIRRLG
ncbi:adenylate/guanylate cyclase domain-containing protein [Thalassospiraceae bacterium LMO-JJ14]|nr:adenylate/guanylate cyclase domain-containing protein [Thalassospiraceae bacterium LMO-JJ14]